jgi:hypothetical protein
MSGDALAAAQAGVQSQTGRRVVYQYHPSCRRRRRTYVS